LRSGWQKSHVLVIRGHQAGLLEEVMFRRLDRS